VREKEGRFICAGAAMHVGLLSVTLLHRPVNVSHFAPSFFLVVQDATTGINTRP
jgi:hypothetical protein